MGSEGETMSHESHPAQVLMVFWNSANGRLTLNEVTSATGLSREQVLAVFRQGDLVFRCESISGSGVYRYVLKPPNTLAAAASRALPQSRMKDIQAYMPRLLPEGTTTAILAPGVPVTLALRE
jgi:hypothetical protein